MKSKKSQLTSLTKKHTKIIAAFFRYQKTLALRAINQRALSVAVNGRQLAAFALDVATWVQVWENIVKKTTPHLQSVITNAEIDGLHAGAHNFQAAVISGSITPTSTAFDLANPRSAAWFGENGGSVKYIAGIQDYTDRQIRETIQTGLDEGQSYGEVATGIKQTFDGISRDRAERIATYEIGNSYEEGNAQFAQDLQEQGVTLLKTWNTSEDDRVSEICQENADAGAIPLDEPFPSGDFEPLAHVNCRCYCTYEEVEARALSDRPLIKYTTVYELVARAVPEQRVKLWQQQS